jgi:hypothetical protein
VVEGLDFNLGMVQGFGPDAERVRRQARLHGRSGRDGPLRRNSGSAVGA